MRILSDFDGVWTDQQAEARFIQVWLAREAAPLIGASPEEALADFDAFFALAMSEPGRNGWAPSGRISGFIDEDPALATGSVFHWLENGGAHEVGGACRGDVWRDRIRAAGHSSIEDYASAHFHPAMEAYRQERGHQLVGGAQDVARELLAAGHELIFVSNSPEAKLQAMLSEAGIAVGGQLRVVGDAKKWLIRNEQPRVSVDGREVYMDRPHYEAILLEVQPDMVVGDVVSFDLALPAYLRWRGRLSKDLRLVLRRSAQSSKWALAQAGSSDAIRLVDEVIDSVAELR